MAPQWAALSEAEGCGKEQGWLRRAQGQQQSESRLATADRTRFPRLLFVVCFSNIQNKMRLFPGIVDFKYT